MVGSTIGRRQFLGAAAAVTLSAGCTGPAPQPPPPSPVPSPSIDDGVEVTQGTVVTLGRTRVGFVQQFGDRVSLSVLQPGDDRFETTARITGPLTLALDGRWWSLEALGIVGGRARIRLVPTRTATPPPDPEHRLLYPGGFARAIGLPRLALTELGPDGPVIERWVDPDPGPDDPGRPLSLAVGGVVQTASMRYTLVGIQPAVDGFAGHVAFTAEAAGE